VKIPSGGHLTEYPLHRILREIISSKGTGILTIQGEIDTIVMTFEFGMCVSAESHYSRQEIRLGQLLLLRGLISEEQLETLLEEQKTSLTKIGYLALNAKIVTAIQLMDALEDQILLMIFPCLTWPKGLFHFRAEEVVHYDKNSARPLDLSLIAEIGDQILKNWHWIEDRLPNFSAAPSLCSGVEVLPPGVQIEKQGDKSEQHPVVLTPEQEKVYSLINGVYTLRQITDACHQFEWTTLNALVDLEDIGIISIRCELERESRFHPKVSHYLNLLKQNFRYIFVAVAVLAVLMLLRALPVTIISDVTARTSVSELRIHTREKMDRVLFAIGLFHFTRKEYPSFLSELVEDQYLDETDLIDFWGSKFYYKKMKNGFDLICSGADKTWATEDDIAFSPTEGDSELASYFHGWTENKTE
jgi:hypothetical protein